MTVLVPVAPMDLGPIGDVEPYIRSLARKVAGRRRTPVLDAEDVAQDLRLAAVRACTHHVPGRGPLVPYLRVVIRNRAIDLLRWWRRRLGQPLYGPHVDGPADVAEPEAGDPCAPDDAAEACERVWTPLASDDHAIRLDVQGMIAGLEPELAVTAAALGTHSRTHVCTQLGISRTSLYRRIRRLRVCFHPLLDEQPAKQRRGGQP